MKSTVKQIRINEDLEAGFAVALFLSAAGYEVRTNIVGGTVLVSADAIDPEIRLGKNAPKLLARQMRAKLDAVAEELELAELSEAFPSALEVA